MDDLSVRALTVVSAVAATESFRRAADDLGMSPSSVSHMVASLEKRLGIQLFVRNTRSVSLTAAGTAFLARVRPALQAISEAVDGAHQFRDAPSGLIRLNASSWAAHRILPLVVDFMREFPEVRVDLVTDGRLIDIVAQGFDAGVRLISVVADDMVALPLGVDESLMIVCAPAYAKARGVPRSPGELLQHECIRARLPSGALMRWEMGQATEEIIVDVRGSLILGTTELAARAAARGAGLAYVDSSEAVPLIRTGELIQVLTEWTPPFAGHAIYYPKQRLPSAAFRAFIEFCRSRLAGVAVGRHQPSKTTTVPRRTHLRPNDRSRRR